MPGHVWTENWSTKTSLITSTHRIIPIPFSNSTPPGCCFGTLSCRRIATRDIRGEPRGEWRGEWRGEPLPTRLRAPETTFDVTWCDMMSKFKVRWKHLWKISANLVLRHWEKTRHHDIGRSQMLLWLSHFNVAQMNLGARLSWQYVRFPVTQTSHSFSACETEESMVSVRALWQLSHPLETDQ